MRSNLKEKPLQTEVILDQARFNDANSAMNVPSTTFYYCHDFVKKLYQTRNPVGAGAAATMVLMYLSAGWDFGYNMAKIFKQYLTTDNGWTEEQVDAFRGLKSQPQIQVLLGRMETQKLLISQKRERGRIYKYFRINPAILCNPNAFNSTNNSEDDLCIPLVETLLEKMANTDKSNYFKAWRSIMRWDFITFLLFMKDQASLFEMDELAKMLEEHINEIERIERDRRSIHGMREWIIDTKLYGSR